MKRSFPLSGTWRVFGSAPSVRQRRSPAGGAPTRAAPWRTSRAGCSRPGAGSCADRAAAARRRCSLERPCPPALLQGLEELPGLLVSGILGEHELEDLHCAVLV